MKEYYDPCEALVAKWLIYMIYLWTRDMQEAPDAETEAYVTQHIEAFDGVFDGEDFKYSDRARQEMAERIVARINL